MGGPWIEIAPELVAKGRHLFEQTRTSQQEIAAMMGISRDTLHRRIREWGWKRRPARSRALDLLHAVRGAAVATVMETRAANAAGGDPISAERRAALAERIMTVVEQEMTVIERMVEKTETSDDSISDNNARMLAGIARTLREIAAFTQPDELAPPDETEDDSVPLDVDELRSELARRINALIDARSAGESGGGGGAGASHDARGD